MAQTKIEFARILASDDLVRDDMTVPGTSLRLAAAFAEALGAEVHLVHVYQTPEFPTPDQKTSLLEGPYLEAMESVLGDEVDFMQQLKPGVRILPVIEKGKTADVLLTDIKAHDCQLVVLEATPQAEQVIRESPVPVLSIGPRAILPLGCRPQRLLVPIDVLDGEPLSQLRQAILLARAFGADLKLVHVIEEWIYPIVESASLLAGGFVMALERDFQELAIAYQEQLIRLAGFCRKRLPGRNIQTELIERATSVEQAILDSAQQNKSDLIVVGHRHPGRVEQALLGGVSRAMIHGALCPVMTVPPKFNS